MENSRSRRGSSAGSSSLEVRCACQYYRSDSLLPERSALAAQYRQQPQQQYHHHLHNNKMVQTPPAGRKSMPVRCGEHEYEPIGQPAIRVSVRERTMSMRLVAPVVKITDTDVIPVGDSDDSLDDRYRFQSRALILDGDVILPLDGRIEDNAMDGKNLGDQTMDDEVESPQEFQDRLEERFQTTVMPKIAGSRTNLQIHASQVDASDKSPQAKDTIGQRMKNSAGRLRTRFKNIQKPTFMTRPRSRSAERPEPIPLPKPPASPRSHQKASRMERFRMALPERPKFSLPDKSKFHLPDKSKFHIDTSKFHIKKPNIQMPKSLSKPKRSASQRETKQPREESHPSETASTKSGRRNIFDFSTLPRPKIFDRKAKAKAEYVTSSPKESRAQSTESSTFPRAKKSGQSLGARWAARFGETIKGFHHDDSAVPPLDRTEPWRHPSLEEPRLSLKPQVSSEGEEVRLPWESTERRYDAEDEAEEDRVDDISYGDRMDIKELEPPFDKSEPIADPRLQDEQFMQRIGTEERKKKVTLVEDTGGSAVDLEAEDEHQTYHPKELGSFPPVDPREFRESTPARAPSAEMSEDEESMRSDREIQQSSGSSCERRRRGVIEEIDSDEFFLREKGISQENMRFHIMSEIREALRPRTDDTPPVPPKRTRSMRKRQEESLESFDVSLPPEKPKREASLRRSQISLDRTNSISSSRHRIVYQTETPPQRDKAEFFGDEPLDSIVVVKPERRKSRTSLRSQSIILPEEEPNILSAPMNETDHVGINAQDIEEMIQRQLRIQRLDLPTTRPAPPAVPTRRKRLRRENQSSSLSIRTNDSALCNGYHDSGSHERIPPPTPPPTPPPDAGISERDIEEMIQRQLRVQHIDELDYIIPQQPVPPKRTRSRTASLAPEDDRTSHGAESLPGDFGYVDEDVPTIPRDSSSREPSLPGYAVIEKRDKPPRPPPPRRKRGKFATAPRPSKNGPKRPTRTYSTLRPAKSDTIRKSTESMPFMDADFSLEQDEPDFHKDLRSGDVLTRMQGRPLPAPPRPPRRRRDFPRQATPITRRSLPREITPDFSETVASTQTDPLPDDLVIEEEVTTAKLVVTPSRSGSLSQVMISTESERVPSPTGGSFKSVTSGTPPIPPLPTGSSLSSRDGDRPHDTGISDRRQQPPSVDRRPQQQFDLSQLELLRSALFSTDEPLRIPHLEVGDLKVDRLTVSQLEAYKVAASEIDAIVVSATEMTGRTDTESIHPSLLQELIAIRNQLQTVAATQPQSRPQSEMEDACTATSNERIDIPFEITDRRLTTTERRPITRESSPLLVVEPPALEKQATGEKGRTLLPHSSSMTDLPSTGSDSITVSDSVSTVIAVEVLDEVTIITTEPPPEDPTTTSTESLVTATATTTVAAAAAASPSRSSSPTRAPSGAVRQTASPVKSLPPVISVTPDAIIASLPFSSSTTIVTTTNTSEPALRHVESSGVQPQRAVISYLASDEDSPQQHHHQHQRQRHTPSRETTPSPQPPSNQQIVPTTQFIAFPTSQIPPEFFNLASSPPASGAAAAAATSEVEPSIADMTGQLLRALSQAGSRSLRHFVDSVVSRFAVAKSTDTDDATTSSSAGQQIRVPDEKLRRVELAVCALLILIAGLIVVCICLPRNVTHHHHWDYFNPPQ